MTASPLPTSGPVAVLLARLQGVLSMGAGWKARCPAHDDRTQSLKVDEGDGGNALVHCHAGCPTIAIVTAVGLTLRDLFADEGGGKFKATDVIAEYRYRGVTGEVLFRVERTVGKEFPQSRPDGNGGWIYKLAGVQRVPYHLPELLAGIAAGRMVFIVEGEKDVHALESLGLVATTAPGGAGKWRAEYTEYFRGARVVCLPDNDNPGRTHVLGADQADGKRRVLGVAPALISVVKELRVIDLPDLPPKGDVSDWLRGGGTVGRLKELVIATPAWEPLAPPPAPPPPGEPPPPSSTGEAEHFPLTDVWNANRLVTRHGADLRYVVAFKSWYIWDSMRWAEDRSHEIIRRAIDTVKSIYAELESPSGMRQRQQLLKHAVQSEKGQRLREMIRLAEALGECPTPPEALDADPWLFNVENGTIDLRSGELRPHTREDLLTRLVPIAYDPEAECPRWLSFLDRIFAGDAELIEFIQRAVGYSLTGATTEQVLFFAHGSGSNGKSVFLTTIGHLLGEYGATADFSTFLERRNEGPRSDLASLKGKRFVSAIESQEGQRLAGGLVKQLTGGDLLTVRALYTNEFTYRPTFKLWFASNHRPVIKDTGDAMWRRVRMIPFAVTIPPEEIDPTLSDTLLRELPGILAWALQGCLLWQETGLGVPPEIEAATAKYRAESDVFGAFLEECCVLEPGAEVSASELLERHTRWAKDTHERELSQRKLSKVMGERPEQFYSVKRSTVYWIGLRLRRDGEAPQNRTGNSMGGSPSGTLFDPPIETGGTRTDGNVAHNPPVAPVAPGSIEGGTEILPRSSHNNSPSVRDEREAWELFSERSGQEKTGSKGGNDVYESNNGSSGSHPSHERPRGPLEDVEL